MTNNESLSMMDTADDLPMYNKLKDKHASNRTIMDNRHESFPDREAQDIIQDEEGFMPNEDPEEGEGEGEGGDGGNYEGEGGEDGGEDGGGGGSTVHTATVSSSVENAKRNVWGKHFPKMYSRGLKALSGFAYKKLIEPKELYEERENLYRLMATEAFTTEKQKRFKIVEAELKEWKERRKEVLDAATIEDDDARAIGELSADLMEARGQSINPGMLLLILLLAPVFNVVIVCITHAFAYKNK